MSELLQLKAPIDTVNTKGETALQVAQKAGHDAVHAGLGLGLALDSRVVELLDLLGAGSYATSPYRGQAATYNDLLGRS